MIIFLSGCILSLVIAILGVFILFQAIRHNTISQELGILGMSGCFCYLMVSLSWLYLKLINQE